MLDITLIREQPKIIRESQERRCEDPSKLDRVIELDRTWREALTRINDLRHRRNTVTQNISQMKKEGEDTSEIIREMKQVSGEIKELEQSMNAYAQQREEALMLIPNLLHESVPPGKTEEEDVPIRFWGTAKVAPAFYDTFRDASNGDMKFTTSEKAPLSHVDILSIADLADIPRAAKVAGSRFFYLKNQLVRLDLALQLHALDVLSERGYTIIEPPFMLNRQAMEGVTDLSAFEDTLYKIEDEDLHLIATSEHALCSMHMDEIFEKDTLPLKYAGISPCFRKEAGAHGKDTKGIFRVHQFNKIEQFIYCHPDDSWTYFEELIENAETIYQDLGIPYRAVDICAGEMGAIASKKVDLECWMPAQGAFREIVSVSNALDYQARRLHIRERHSNENIIVHTLNGTAIATSRVMVAILENFQEDGVILIPEVLHKYTGFKEIPMIPKNGEGPSNLSNDQ